MSRGLRQSHLPATPASHRRDVTALLTVATATAVFIVTSWFANATFSEVTYSNARRALQHALHVDPGDTLTVLSTLQGTLTFLMSMVLDNTLELVQWSLIGRKIGLDALSILALSPSTGAVGSLGILFSATAKTRSRLWASLKSVPNLCFCFRRYCRS
jgi:hypothetical protein